MTGDRQVRMVLVAAVADNGVIARGGALPWDIPEDTEHYLRTVRHHAVLLGRTTYDEIGGPMPDCTTIARDVTLLMTAMSEPDSPVVPMTWTRPRWAAIATLAMVAAGTVKSRMHYAKKALRRLYEDEL